MLDTETKRRIDSCRDILVGKVPDPKSAICDEDARGYIYPDLMIRIRADESKILSRFLLEVLQGQPIRNYLKRHTVGAAGSMPKINQGI